MVANLCVFGGLDPDKRSIVNFTDSPENFCFARAGPSMHKDVTRSHRLLNVSVNLPHPVFVSYCLSDNPFCFSLRNDVFVQLTHQFGRCHGILHVHLQLIENVVCIFLLHFRKFKERSQTFVAARIVGVRLIVMFGHSEGVVWVSDVFKRRFGLWDESGQSFEHFGIIKSI